MRYVEVPPSDDLARDVQCYWELESGAAPLSEPIFPDGRVEIVVHLAARPRRLGDGCAQPDVMAVGQMTTALRLAPTPGMHAVGIRFTPVGARLWLGTPLSVLTDCLVSADQIDRRVAASIRDAVHEGGGLTASLGSLESALRRTRNARWATSPAVERAVHMALVRRGQIRVAGLTDATGLSVRQIERQFLEAVGLPPKRFLTTLRFQHALQLLRAGHLPIDAASACGFSDQAHLARAFREMAGAPARDVRLTDVAFL